MLSGEHASIVEEPAAIGFFFSLISVPGIYMDVACLTGNGARPGSFLFFFWVHRGVFGLLPRDLDELNNAHRILYKYEEAWNMSYNPGPCNVSVIGFLFSYCLLSNTCTTIME